MDTGRYFSSVLFGGRPRRGRLVPSFASIPLRAASTSRAVTRRARSKGNSFSLVISPSFLSARWSRADETVDVVRLADGEHDHHEVRVRLPDQPPPRLRR